MPNGFEDHSTPALVAEIISRIDNSNGLDFVQIGVLAKLAMRLTAYIAKQLNRRA